MAISYQINFKIDPKIDTSNCIKVTEEYLKGHGKWYVPMFFNNDIKKVVLNKKLSAKERSKIIKSYANNIYSVDKARIEEEFRETVNYWRKVEKPFLEFINETFKDFTLNKKYTGFLTIFKMSVFDPDKGVFFFSYKDSSLMEKYCVQHIANEVFTFTLLDYIYKKCRTQKMSQKNNLSIIQTFTNLIITSKCCREILDLKVN